MASFIIEGGHKLGGDIRPQGAKNEALQIICATLLTQDEVVVRYLQSEAFLKTCASLRGSVMLAGPLVTRFGQAVISKPGGDKIGRRRLDTHFIGIQKLGANFNYNADRHAYEIEAEHLRGTYMLASVTGTANIIMAAVLAEGRTVIYNAACEPYVQQLCHLLNRMGAKISGIASNLLTIDGVEALHGAEHTILPDMIEVGSFIGMAAMTRSELTIKDVVGSFIGMAAMTRSELTIKDVSYQHLGIIPDSFRRLGIRLEQKGDDIYVPAQEHYRIESFMDGSIMTIADAPWPGLTPDLLSVMLVVATQAQGSVLIHQKMFESRLFFVDKLIDMGAQIILSACSSTRRCSKAACSSWTSSSTWGRKSSCATRTVPSSSVTTTVSACAGAT